MKIVADEGTDAPIVANLRKNGYEVIYIREISPGISDDKVLSLANQQQAIVLTSDKDFGELVFKNKAVSKGIILCRLHGIPPMEKAEIVMTVIKRFKGELVGSFTVISRNLVKIRSLQ